MSTMTETAVDMTARLQEETVAGRRVAPTTGRSGPPFTTQSEGQPLRFLLLIAPVDALQPESVTAFATEDEARTAFSKSQSEGWGTPRWVELARVGGGNRPAIVVWTGRPFPPVGEDQLLAMVRR